MMGALRYLAALLIVGICCSPAHAESRIALVIGNSAYKNVANLPNPVSDASLIGGMLKNAGFDFVSVRLDLSIGEMRKALREFGAKARDADLAVIYYAGHGIELDGNNYLIPVDASLESDTDVLDEALPLDRVMFAVEPVRHLRLIILDACRDNPFAKTMKRTVASRAIGRGLAKVEPSNLNTMIAFAAKAGSTASDGNAKNSPFAIALAEHLPKPGLDLRKAFGFVRDDVLKSTGNRQEPYVYGSLGGDDVPLVPAKPVAAAPQPTAQDAVRRDYELALQAGDREAWEAFLQTYSDGFYANLARVQLKKLAAEEVRAAAAEKARQAEQEKARLVAERGKAAEQERAAALARAAEEARAAAERDRMIEQARADAAEKARAEAELASARQQADAKAAAERKAAELAMAPVDPAPGDQKMAALTPPSRPVLSETQLATFVQLELRRVGCFAAPATGNWDKASQGSLASFNNFAGTRLDVQSASIEALDVIRAKTSRVCPLVCERGYQAANDMCVKVTCRSGYQLQDNGSCEQIEKPVAKRTDEGSRPKANQRSLPADRPAASLDRPQPGEPPAGTIPLGARVIVQSSACRHGQVLELIGGSNQHNIPRRRRCVAAD
jgi:uncharacterized caspase-like protein